MTMTTEPTTRTLAVPGVVLTYDVRPGSDTAAPPLLLIGSPMGAGGFGTLASHFPDRTVVTYDPRGVDRSAKAEPRSNSPRTSTRTTSAGSSPSWAPARLTSLRAAAGP